MPIISHQRGRPKKKDGDKRSKNVQARLSEDTYEAVVALAKKNRIPIGTYIRVVLEEAVDRDRDLARYGYDEH